MKKMFLAIEVNLILWIVLTGYLLTISPGMTTVRLLASAGFVFAALIQHAAYYSMWKSKPLAKAE